MKQAQRDCSVGVLPGPARSDCDSAGIPQLQGARSVRMCSALVLQGQRARDAPVAGAERCK